MRIVIAGDRHWHCPDLGLTIMRRLLARYGPEIVIALGGYPGVDWSFSTACRKIGVEVDIYLSDFSRIGDYRFGNRQLLRHGADLCLIVHRDELDDGSKDLARQAVAAGIPTFLIADERAIPSRLNAGDERLTLR
jgi:hypothetical protein